MFLRREHYKVFFGDVFVVVQRRAGINWAVVARLAQARYPAYVIFFKMKMASPAIRFLRNTQARSTCYSPPRWATNIS